jgi:hypothetical protein
MHSISISKSNEEGKHMQYEPAVAPQTQLIRVSSLQRAVCEASVSSLDAGCPCPGCELVMCAGSLLSAEGPATSCHCDLELPNVGPIGEFPIEGTWNSVDLHASCQ